ncbi:MAG TPA: hypothetical protein VNM22_09045 [Candidatus Limnocylindrales bacterium]|nr:hypothetical protein [Candidatus Limnocylindrales bacterium]
MKKSVCIISFSPIYRDGRVLRQIKYLSRVYDLTVIGYGPPHPDWKDKQGIKWISVVRKPLTLTQKFSELILLMLLGRLRPSFYDYWYWRRLHHRQALEHAMASPGDAFHANDWEALPVAAEAARRHQARLVFDAHEYGPLEFEDRRYWRLLYSPAIRYILHRYAHWIDASTTVAPLLAKRYRQEFNLNPLVVLNAPEYVDVAPKKLNPDDIRLIHHGSSIRDRRLERMIETLAWCDRRYSLHFMLMDNDPSYLQYLKKLADEVAPGRVFFHNPVAPGEVVERISEYDMGFYLLEPGNFNNSAALPNKFFDFIVAGLAVCIGPSPSMAELVRQYGFGCVAPTFNPSDVAHMLNQLNINQLMAMQQAAREVARQLNADTEMGKVVELYQQLLGETRR